MRLSTGLAGLVSVLLFAACGGGSGSNGVDGGNTGDAVQPDSNTPPMANCTPLDLASAAAISCRRR
jgi:hypothetical protein